MAEARASSPARKPKYSVMTMQELEQRRKDEFVVQEQALDDIHGGVKGLKHHAIAINKEVDTQIASIDSIDEGVDKAHADLVQGEKEARIVNAKKAAVYRLYGFIAVLVVVEIVMSAAGIRLI